MIEVKTINAEDTYPLRQKVLRPHQSVKECQYQGDHDDMTAHFGAFSKNKLVDLVGIVSIYKAQSSQLELFLDHPCLESWQLRAMAVSHLVRKKGYGLELLTKAEVYATLQGATYVWANSRINAIRFYQKAGYSLLGNEFEISGIGSHYLIYKYLLK